jgi:hypothetical protein
MSEIAKTADTDQDVHSSGLITVSMFSVTMVHSVTSSVTACSPSSGNDLLRTMVL